MKKPTYEEQNAVLSKYIAPIFLDLDFRPVYNDTLGRLWDKVYTEPEQRKQDIEKMRNPTGQLWDVRAYNTLEEFGKDLSKFLLDIRKKPIEVLESRILREVQVWGEGLRTSDTETNFRREELINFLLTEYKNRVKTKDRDPRFTAFMRTFKVTDDFPSIDYRSF